MKKEIKKEIQKLLIDRLNRSGLSMEKKISSGGLFIESTYDKRKATSIEEVWKLTKEGFLVAEDTGVFIWNAIFN
jgi:hypothetical protein